MKHDRPSPLSRRTVLKRFGLGGAILCWAPGLVAVDRSEASARMARIRKPDRAHPAIWERVQATPLVDTHEHLIEESERLQGERHPRVRCDDWAVLLSHYLDSDLRTAGMPNGDWQQFFSPNVDPLDKWKLIEPWWPAVKNTGYGQAVRIACRELYNVPDLSSETVAEVQAGYERVRRKGFYHEILKERANILSCQVNCLTGEPFKESEMPELLMQDISLVGMFSGPSFRTYAGPTGIEVTDLSDWHRVIDWWFDRYGDFAVAVKSQQAYSRDIDYQPTPAEVVEGTFKRLVEKQSISGEDRRQLENHLFWYAVKRSTAAGLPVKLHTGYYAGHDSMPLGRLLHNAGSASDLCRAAPDTRFVFMHICYPYYEEMIALAKQWTNATVDMCWSWIINPEAAKDFLKKFLITAPANKVLAFGGDYIPVEPVLGHAAIARQGIALALSELVDEGWLSLSDALELPGLIMHQNAERLFRLEAKEQQLRNAPWLD